MSLETRAIPHGKTWSNLGEHGEQEKHRKKGKHQPDDLKHSTYDSKHSISHQNTLSVNKITQNTLFNGTI